MKKLKTIFITLGLVAFYFIHCYGQIDPSVNPNKALLIASKLGKHEQILDLIRIYGADVNTVDENKQTPIMHAAYRDNVNTVQRLLQFQPNLDLQDKDGNTALILAIDPSPKERITEHTYDIVSILLEHNANPLIQNNKGKTAFDLVRIKKPQDDLAQQAQSLLARYIHKFQ